MKVQEKTLNVTSYISYFISSNFE